MTSIKAYKINEIMAVQQNVAALWTIYMHNITQHRGEDI